MHYLTSSTGLFAIFVTTSTEGRQMYYTFKDHQGSLAAVVHGSTVERLSYDPWGRRRNPVGFGYDNVSHTFDRGFTLRRTDYATCPNRRLFGGKELQDETLAGVTLNLYDFEARMYDPTIGRFLSVDPLAENYYGIPPFTYCGNDPMNAVDLHGDSISILYTSVCGQQRLIFNNGILLNSDNSVYDGEVSGFLQQSVSALNTIRQCDEGDFLINELQTSFNMFTIKESHEKNSFKELNHNKAYAKQIQSNPELYASFLKHGEKLMGGSPGTVYWNTEGVLLPTTSGLKKNAAMDLAHELCHALDSDRGLLNAKEIQDVSYSDYQAIYRENRIRGQLGNPLRTHYNVGVDPSGNPIGGTGPSMLTRKNQPIRPAWY